MCPPLGFVPPTFSKTLPPAKKARLTAGFFCALKGITIKAQEFTMSKPKQIPQGFQKKTPANKVVPLHSRVQVGEEDTEWGDEEDDATDEEIDDEDEGE